MRKLLFVAIAALFALPAIAAAETFNNVAVVDVACSKKVMDNPDGHSRGCALKCEESGYGIITADKKFIKLDKAGNEKVVEALKASDKKDHLRVDVTGEVNGDTLKVETLKLL